MSIILKESCYGDEGSYSEFELTRALSSAERYYCQTLANEQGAGWIEFYSLHEACIPDPLDPSAEIGDPNTPEHFFIDPHPICIPEIRAYLESLS